MTCWLRVRGACETCALSLAVSFACSTPSSQARDTNRENAFLATRTDKGLELRATLRKDTVNQGEKGPVEVMYVVANGPGPTPFVNDPTLFVIKVEELGGRQAPYTSNGGPVFGSWGSQTRIVLPANAVLGQVEDLRCLSDASYATKAPISCVMSYSLDAAGSYRVIVEYHGLDLAGTGPVLADTVPLVVR